MIEQKIEKRVIDKIDQALKARGVTDIQIIGAWQPGSEIKGMEDCQTGVLTVKARPRSYETPTIPDASIQIEINLLVRSDVDYKGQGYLEVTDIISRVMHHWQKCQEAYYPDFVIPGEYEPTGYVLEGGDCGVDKQECLWSFSQIFTIYGIIQD